MSTDKKNVSGFLIAGISKGAIAVTRRSQAGKEWVERYLGVEVQRNTGMFPGPDVIELKIPKKHDGNFDALNRTLGKFITCVVWVKPYKTKADKLGIEYHLDGLLNELP